MDASKTTAALAGWVAGLGHGYLSTQDVELAKIYLLDSLGCLLAGTGNEPPRKAAAGIRRLSGAGRDATMFVDGAAAAARDAAFVNAVAMYSVALNGHHKPSRIHPGVSILPVLLALGEQHKCNGRDFLLAMVCGYEIAGRIGKAVAPGLVARGFSPNGTVAVFAATAAAARILRLPAECVRNAFGINGSQAAGLQEWHTDAALTVVFHAGRAAQNALEAIVLAQEGITGPATVLEGREGFFQAFSDTVNLEPVCSDLRRATILGEVTIRPYFGATPTIASSSAAVAIIKRIGKSSINAIREVLVSCNPLDGAEHDFADPRSLQGARQSMQFNVALALAYGAGQTRDLNDRDLWHPDIRKLLAVVRLVPDDCLARYEGKVEVRLEDGSTEAELCTAPLGDPQNPMNWDQIVEKFVNVVSSSARSRQRAAMQEVLGNVIDLVSRFETIEVAQLVDALASAASLVRLAASEGSAQDVLAPKYRHGLE